MNANLYRSTSSTALILVSDPLAAALIGAAVELAEIGPAFPRREESPRAALLRVRPMCVLLGHDEPSALDDAFMGPAMMTGARLFFIGPERRLRALESFLDRYRIGVIVLPRDLESLRERLTGESESSPRRPELTER